jgi:V8-like Glu-specific endopeptidase
MLARITGLLAIFATSVCVDAAIFGADDRVRVAPDYNSPFAAVGRVTGGHRYGTGFMVSKCHLLSAKHILSDRRSVIGRKVTFEVRLRPGETVSSEGTVIADGGFDIGDLRTNPKLDARDDWVLIRLEECLGQRLGYLSLADHDTLTTNELLRSAGYPRGSLGHLVIDPSCRVHFQTAAEWLHDCATLPGSSGGPIFRHHVTGGKERLDVLGMQTGGADGHIPQLSTSRGANAATKSSYLSKAIKAHL